MRPPRSVTNAGGVLDPYRACLGLAAAAADRGATIFERSPVRKITFGRRKADVITAGGSIRADRVIIATGMPTPLFKSLRPAFLVSHDLSGDDGAGPGQDPPAARTPRGGRPRSGEPPHVVRWVDDERLLVAGADTLTPPDRQRDDSPCSGPVS